MHFSDGSERRRSERTTSTSYAGEIKEKFLQWYNNSLSAALRKELEEFFMNNKESLAHTSWNCKFHIVFAPKYRRREIYGALRRDIGRILRML